MAEREVLDLHIRILTPTHVGGASEKHLKEGVDYICKDGKVYYLDLKKILAHPRIKEEQLYNALTERNGLRDFLKNIDIAEVSNVERPMSGRAEDLRTIVKNGLTGKPILPGSSIRHFCRNIVSGDQPILRIDQNRISNKPDIPYKGFAIGFIINHDRFFLRGILKFKCYG